MRIREIKVKSIITKSNLPGTDFAINPYVGCNHACFYCYARFMKRFTGHLEKWGSFVDVKINAADLIPEKTDKYRNKSILLSSVTDPYLPLEKKYKLTRKILEKLIPLQPDLGILTKSSLVLRDIDLLKQFNNCEVGITITTLENDIRKEIEPATSSVNDRIKALKELKKQGIGTYVFIGPILPYLTDWQKIVEKTKNLAHYHMFENLTVRGDIWMDAKKWLKEKHSNLLKNYEDIYFNGGGYWDEIEQEIKQFGELNNFDFRIYFHH